MPSRIRVRPRAERQFFLRGCKQALRSKVSDETNSIPGRNDASRKRGTRAKDEVKIEFDVRLAP